MGARRRQSAKQVPKVQEDAKWSRMEPNGSEKAESCQQMANAAGK